jgi:hypothetical protein
MSHFFQRLASSVTRPSTEPRLRPLVSSVYIPAGLAAGSTAPLDSIASESPAPEPRTFTAPEFAARPGLEPASPGAPMRSAPRTSQPPAERPAAPQSPAEASTDFALTESSSPPHLLPLERLQAQAPGLPGESGQNRIETSPRDDAGNKNRSATASPAPSLTHSQPIEPFKTHASELPPESGRNRINMSLVNDDAGKNNRSRFASPALLTARNAVPVESSPARYQPLISPAQLEAPGVLLGKMPQTAPPLFSAKAAAGEPARRAASPACEPDEIFIHIGRVEVAAVTQPASRPAPAPQRKSINLSEYLRRGNGRSR